MKITADTNLLVRAITMDDPGQAALAAAALANAQTVAVTIPALCELVWVLSRSYMISQVEIAATIRTLLNAANVVTNHPAAEAGLAAMQAGAGFADGAIAYEGAWLGGEVFVSFDRQAVNALGANRVKTKLLA